MKSRIVITCFFVFVLTICRAQTNVNTKFNALSFELGKTGLIYNVTFDHRFQNNNAGLRIGVGSNFARYLQAFTAGVGGYYLLGHTTDFFETGIDLCYLSIVEISDDQKGFTILTPDYPVKTYYASANIGYRRYGANTLFRIGVSPGFIKNDFLPGGYLSYGFRL